MDLKIALLNSSGNSKIVVGGELELMFTNTKARKIIHISKTNQDNLNL